jgi:hypothetical protein
MFQPLTRRTTQAQFSCGVRQGDDLVQALEPQTANLPEDLPILCREHHMFRAEPKCQTAFGQAGRSSDGQAGAGDGNSWHRRCSLRRIRAVMRPAAK